MALGTFISGRYAGAYNSVDVGITEEGFKITNQFFQELIQESDAYGQSPIEGLYRGGDCICEFLCLEAKAGSYSPFWPWAAAVGQLVSAIPIGSLATDNAQAMVLTAVAGTPAAAGALAPASLTASKALLRENYPTTLLFGTKLRKVPISLRFWPYVSTQVKFFVTS